MAVSGITVSGTPPRLSSPKTIPPDVNKSTLEDLEANTIPRMDAGISMRDPKAKYKRFDLWNWIRIDPGKITRFRIESRRYWGTLFAIKNNFRSYIVFIILIKVWNICENFLFTKAFEEEEFTRNTLNPIAGNGCVILRDVTSI